jgi:hypothetical protein
MMGIWGSARTILRYRLCFIFLGLQRFCGFTAQIYDCNRRPEMVCMQERFKQRKNDSEWMAQVDEHIPTSPSSPYPP